MTFYSLTFLLFFAVASLLIHFVPDVKWNSKVEAEKIEGKTIVKL